MNSIEIWRKSNRSGQNGDCVEVSNRGGVRDSKNRTGPELRFGRPGLQAFITAARSGRLGR